MQCLLPCRKFSSRPCSGSTAGRVSVVLWRQVRNSSKTPLMTCLLEGAPGTGKTALAATIGIDSDFPFVKVVSAENYVGWSEQSKCSAITKVFDDAYKVRLVLDSWCRSCTHFAHCTS